MEQSFSLRYHTLKKKLFDKYYSNLNSEQREAVYSVNGPLLILAGAGSGKTTVLVNRIAHIIIYGNSYYDESVPCGIGERDIEEMQTALTFQKEKLKYYLLKFAVNPCKPYGVLAFTFTNKAAKEIKERLEKTLHGLSDGIWTGTFHSVCMRILRRNGEAIGLKAGFGVCDSDDSKKVMSNCIKELDEKRISVKEAMINISAAKDNLITVEEYEKENASDYKYRKIAEIYKRYQEKLEESNLVDFDDIIMKTVLLLRKDEKILSYYQNLFKYVCVDEYQDTNKAQFVLVSLLSGYYKNLMVVGDDNQSIYKFRGATIENILNFSKIYTDAKIVKLEQNYRSTKNILTAANSIIKNNSMQYEKNLWSDNDQGQKIIFRKNADANAEARYISDKIVSLKKEKGYSFNDFTILYRMNVLSRPLEKALSGNGIPYKILGGLSFYDRKEVKDIIAYLSLINNFDDAVRLERIINEPKRKIGETSYSVAVKIAGEEQKPVFEIIKNATSYGAIPKSTAIQMENFAELIQSLKESMKSMTLYDFTKKVIKDTGYENMIISLGETEKERLDYLNDFCASVKEYEESASDPTLTEFLEQMTLISDIDKYDENSDYVTLMTVHSAKGLEFPVVFIPAMEEGIFPSFQSKDIPSELEEERRLAYVAVTRAKKELYISCSRERMIFGNTQYYSASRFVKEINTECLEEEKDRYTDDSGNIIFSALNRMSKKTNTPYINNNEKKEKAKIIPYEIGDSVIHNIFGKGMVMNVIPLSNDYMYEIAFEKTGTKKVMATFVENIMKKI